MSFEIIGRAPQLKDGTKVPLSPAIRLGELVYLSGQLPFDATGQIAAENIEEQTRQCLENIENVLVSCGLGLKDVFKASIWLTDKKNFAGFNKSYGKFFTDNFPVRSVVQSDLMIPGALVEIEVVACSTHTT